MKAQYASRPLRAPNGQLALWPSSEFRLDCNARGFIEERCEECVWHKVLFFILRLTFYIPPHSSLFFTCVVVSLSVCAISPTKRQKPHTPARGNSATCHSRENGSLTLVRNITWFYGPLLHAYSVPTGRVLPSTTP